MSPRTGRPPIENPRKNKVETRMSDDELEKLDYCCEVSRKARSEIIREGIDIIYAKLGKSKQK